MSTTTSASHRDLHNYISEIAADTDVQVGSPMPFGTQEKGGGVNFALFSRHASRDRLELFNHPAGSMHTRTMIADSHNGV